MSRAAGALVAAIVASLYFSLTAPYGLELRDEGHILARSLRVIDRQLPNADFSDVYGPGVSTLNALVLALFDHRVIAVRWTLVALKAMAVGAIWLAACEVAPAPIAAGATVFAILTFGRASWNLNTPYAALYVLAFGMVALALLLRALAKGSARLAGAAGFVIGTALLFKHSLAAMYAVSLSLGIVASMLLEPAPPRSRAERAMLSALFAVLLVLSLLVHEFPFGFVEPRSYLLFFAPAHVLGVLVLTAPARTGVARGGLGLSALVGAGVGLVVMPAAVATLYASRGALGAALGDLARWPPMLAYYAGGFALPSLADVALLAFVVALSGAGLWHLVGRRRAAIACATVAVALAVLGLGEGGWLRAITAEADAWWYALPSLLGYVLLAACGPALRSRDRPAWLVPALAVAFFHHATGFQMFPRAGLNAIMTVPVLAPSLAVVAAAVWRGLGLSALDRRRRPAAYALLALPAVVLAVPALVSVADLRNASKLPIPFPETRGLSIRADAADDVLSMQKLLAYLEGQRESPLLLLNNDAMIVFLAHRRLLFPDLDLLFELMGQTMLDAKKLPGAEVSVLVARLDAEGDPLVVVKDDDSTRAIRKYLWILFAHLGQRFEPAFTAGRYTVLRRAPRHSAGAGAGCLSGT